ncbi:MAG: hypothetical protein E7440_00090 [Ruminococcaceae bacterium]|nr:hypothetical protein [Oscillospiraceae bacterium]
MARKKTATGVITWAVIVLTVVLFFYTLRAISGETQYSYYTVASVFVELMFILLSASTYLDILRGSRTRRMFVQLFLWMIAIVSIGMLGDVFAWGIGMERFGWAPFTRWMGAFLRDAMGFPLIVVYSTYLISYINQDPQVLSRYAWLVGGLCADGLILVVIAQFTAVSEAQTWYLWDYPWLFLFFLALPMAVNIGIIFYFRKALTNRKAITFILYELLVLLAVMVDILVEEMTLAYAMAAFALLRIYISVQLEYEKQQEEQLVQQRISIMLSQIRPHFLYNVLTGIRTLCREAPPKAEEALLEFTSYLRANLNSLTTEECIPFVRELEHTRHYIQLEKMRYGDDLKVEFHIGADQFSIPALTLEPIVENAVRHGVMQREQGGTITIQTSAGPDGWRITVTDDGVGFDTQALDGSGTVHVGMSNVRERLSAMCGGTLRVSSVPGAGTQVELFIPRQEVEEE